MPNWKKLITSGSSGSLAHLSVDTSVEASSFTGSLLSTNGVLSSSAQIDGFVSKSANFTTNELLVADGTNSVVSSNILSLDTVNNYLGINQSNPEVTLHMTGEDAQTAQIRMEQYNNTSDAPDIRTRRYRGTAASPAAVQSGDYLFRSNHEYWNGTSLVTGGSFAFDNTNNAARTQFAVAVDKDGTGSDILNDKQFLIDGNDSGAITFNEAYKFPTSDGNANEVLTSDGNGTLTFSNPIPANTVSSSAQIVANLSNQDVDFGTGDITGSSFTGSFVGDGSGLTGINSSIVSSSTVTDSFTNETTHSIAHTLGTKDVIVNVYDSNDDIFVPTRINTPTTSSVVIYMDPATSGRVVIGKSGHVVSGSADVDLSAVSEHILPSINDTYDLGSSTKQWRDLYLSSGSLYIDGTQIVSSTSETLTFTTDTGQSIKLLEEGADDIILQTDTGNIELKGTVEVLTGKKITDSAGSSVHFGDSISVTGSINVSGNVDGIDLQAFSSSVSTSLANSTADYTQLSNVPSGIVSGAAQVVSLTSDTTTFTSVTEVTASHNLGTKNVTVSVYGNDDFMIFPTSIKTHDDNNVYVQFNSSRSGRIVITK